MVWMGICMNLETGNKKQALDRPRLRGSHQELFSWGLLEGNSAVKGHNHIRKSVTGFDITVVHCEREPRGRKGIDANDAVTPSLVTSEKVWVLC
jgi:hypothetical protein